MKQLSILFAFLFIASISYAQKSPRKQSQGTIDGTAIAIDYGAPSVKGRTIWGGLEKYGKVWRAGANENTTVTLDKDVKINGKTLKAGKYGFFIIPNKDKDWVAIFNTKNDGWGAYAYKQSQDALRVNIKPEFVEDTQEMLSYSIDDDSINFAWDKARLSIPVK